MCNYMQYCMNKELTLNEELLSLIRFFLFFCVNPTQIQDLNQEELQYGKERYSLWLYMT